MMLREYAKHADLFNNELLMEAFERRFKQASFKEQYEAVTQLFVNRLETEHQIWIMEKAHQMTKSGGNTSMVEFFIKNFSYGEMEELRRSIWMLMK